MTEYALYLESGPRRRTTMVHVLDRLGCIAQEPTTEEALQAAPEAIRAYLRLEPDLNDGVALNIAPLWEWVPWKEAQRYWEELLAGKYQWSSIGKQLQEKGWVKRPCD